MLVFIGCQQDAPRVQTGFGGSTDVVGKMLRLPTRNIRIDSIRTDNEGHVVFGRTDRGDFGKVEAVASLSFSFSSGKVFEEGSVLRKLEFHYVIPVVDQARPPLVFQVHALTRQLSRTAAYHGYHAIDRDLNSLSSFDHEFSDDTPYYSADISEVGEYAAEILKEYHQQWKERDKSVSAFDYPVGIALSLPESLNRMVTMDSHADSTYLEVEFLDTNSEVGRARLNLVKYFSHLERDRSGSRLEGVEDLQAFDLQDGSVHVDPLAGVYTVISLDPLVEYLQSSPPLIFSYVEASLPPLAGVAPYDTLLLASLHFRNARGGVDGIPFLSSRSINHNQLRYHILLTDQTYLQSQNSPFFLGRAPTQEYKGSITLFCEFLQLTIDSGNLDRFASRELVMLPLEFLSLKSAKMEGPCDVSLRHVQR